jgi:hypothetical protein
MARPCYAPFRCMHWLSRCRRSRRPRRYFQYQPTMQDVDPGIDHCNSDENVPYELKKWCFTGLSNRRAPSLSIPRSVICPTHAIRYGIGVGRAGFHLARLVANKPKGRMAGLASTPEMIERQPYLPRFTAGGPGNPPRYVSRQYRLPHPRYQCVGDDRPSRFIRLLPAGQ